MKKRRRSEERRRGPRGRKKIVNDIVNKNLNTYIWHLSLSYVVLSISVR